MSFDGYWVYVYLLLAGFVATDAWRFAGVFLSKDLAPDSEVLVWVRAVSSALIAGLVARMVVFPAGALAQVPLWARLGAVAFGVAVFLVAKRNLGAGVLAAIGALVAAQVLFG